MKKITLLSLLFFCLSLKSQEWKWARKADSTSEYELVRKIETDGFGNLYLLGASNGSSKYGNTLLAPGDFIVKFDSSGTVIWAKNIDFVYDFYVDDLGNIYLTGHYYNNVTILSFNFVSNGEEDLYVIKLDSYGTPVWGRSFGGPGGDTGSSLAIDDQQNIYFAGSFGESISFDGQTLVDSNGHFFLAKLNPSGNTIWATKGDSAFSRAGIIRLDNNSHVYVISYSGKYYGSFIARFDTSGNLQSKYLKWGVYDYVPALEISDEGNIFALHNGGGHYGYVPILVKYDSLMNEQWSCGIGTYYGCYQLGAGLIIDKSENIYVGGSIGGEYCHEDSVFFQGQLGYVGNKFTSIIAKFNSLGNLMWMETATSADYNSIASISQDKSGNLYVAGAFNSTTNSSPDTLSFDSQTLISDGSWSQIFIAKLDPSANPTRVKEIHSDNSLVIYPNPSSGKFTINFDPIQTGVKLIIRDALGNSVFEKNSRGERTQLIDLSSHTAGIYFVEIISTNNTKVVKKLIVN